MGGKVQGVIACVCTCTMLVQSVERGSECGRIPIDHERVPAHVQGGPYATTVDLGGQEQLEAGVQEGQGTQRPLEGPGLRLHP